MSPRVPLHALSQQHTRAAAGQVQARHDDVERRVRHDAVGQHGDNQVQALHVEARVVCSKTCAMTSRLNSPGDADASTKRVNSSSIMEPSAAVNDVEESEGARDSGGDEEEPNDGAPRRRGAWPKSSRPCGAAAQARSAP
mmetsp:Transcript_28263/g.100323  ORF Transcript_28263/g.100323 Transcript_28263/m.100323 type:complete len:140 (-) Transcript_28263:540-959(-)